MEDLINIDIVFEKVILIEKKITGREFDGCTFKNCDFSNSYFSECQFIDCEFIDCNLSMAKLPGTALKTIQFRDCKLLGIQFHECDNFLFNVGFATCTLDYSWFINKKMQKTNFINCSLKGVNFSGADLTSSNFENANLEGAIFDGTLLKATDFTTAYNFKIDPETNSVKSAKFSTSGVHGLLEKYDIKIV